MPNNQWTPCFAAYPFLGFDRVLFLTPVLA